MDISTSETSGRSTAADPGAAPGPPRGPSVRIRAEARGASPTALSLWLGFGVLVTALVTMVLVATLFIHRLNAHTAHLVEVETPLVTDLARLQGALDEVAGGIYEYARTRDPAVRSRVRDALTELRATGVDVDRLVSDERLQATMGRLDALTLHLEAEAWDVLEIVRANEGSAADLLQRHADLHEMVGRLGAEPVLAEGQRRATELLVAMAGALNRLSDALLVYTAAPTRGADRRMSAAADDFRRALTALHGLLRPGPTGDRASAALLVEASRRFEALSGERRRFADGLRRFETALQSFMAAKASVRAFMDGQLRPAILERTRAMAREARTTGTDAMGLVIVIGLLAAIVGVLSAVSVTRSVLRAERKLAASEQGYRTLFEQAGEGILRTDTEGVVLDANPVAAAMFGFEPKELRGVPLEQLFETRSMERQPPQLDRLRRGEVVRSEREAIRRGGGTFPLESVATMVSDGNVVLLCRDMSAHWAQQRELLAARERAELASRAKTVFLDTMTHELRTPLNGIIGAAGVLAEARLTDRAGAMVDDIRDSGRRLLRLLDRILMYTGLEAGRVRPGAESFDLLSTLRVVLGPLAEEAALKGVHLEWEVGAEVPRALNCDVGLLRVVLENLVGNAVKFTEYGAVRVRVRAVGGSRAGGGAAPGGGADCFESFLITVADTGPGMTREELDRLYTPFHQADGSWTRQFGGIGIGLATCRRAVELMGGMLSIEGEPDKGSFAAALLPMAVPGVLRDLAVGHLPPLEPVGLGRRVVVLEPNRAVCEYLRLGLELRGFVPVVPDRGSGEGAFSGGGAEGPLGDFDLTVLGCGLSPTGAFGFDPEAVARPVAVLTIGGGGDPAAQCGRADVAADRPPDLDELASALARAAASGRKGASAA